jgi:hypothetical protein
MLFDNCLKVKNSPFVHFKFYGAKVLGICVKNQKKCFRFVAFFVGFCYNKMVRGKDRISGEERRMKHLRLKGSIFGLSIGQVASFVAVKISK